METEKLLLYGGLAVGAIYLANKFLNFNFSKTLGQGLGSAAVEFPVAVAQGAYNAVDTTVYQPSYKTGYDIGQSIAPTFKPDFLKPTWVGTQNWGTPSAVASYVNPWAYNPVLNWWFTGNAGTPAFYQEGVNK